ISDITAGIKCSCNCFGSAMGTKQKKGSDSFWPRFKRRIKHDRKGKTYSVEISPTAGKSKALVRILSVSAKGDFIPVTIVSPIDNPTEIITVKSQKSEEKEEVELSKPAHRSWVRVVVGAFGFSRSQSGKVQQVPAVKTAMVDSPKIRRFQKTSSPRDSTLGPVEQQLSVATHSKPPVTEKTKGINLHSKIKAHAASAPCSPMKSRRAAAQPASTSHIHLPPSRLSDEISPAMSFNIHRSAVTNKAITKSAIALKGSSQTVVNLEFTEGYDAAIGVSVLIVVMLCLVLSDKLVAIVCTSLWWYAVAVVKDMARSNEAPNSKPVRVKKQMTKSLSHNNSIDLQSSEYKKKCTTLHSYSQK
ncbi:hypothetical protein KI387_018186, partial [Taxus chinensis]